MLAGTFQRYPEAVLTVTYLIAIFSTVPCTPEGFLGLVQRTVLPRLSERMFCFCRPTRANLTASMIELSSVSVHEPNMIAELICLMSIPCSSVLKSVLYCQTKSVSTVGSLLRGAVCCRLRVGGLTPLPHFV